MSSTSAQVHVCQIPRSLWRMAGRAPKIWALRTSNLGNVSAPAAAFGATALSSREAAHFGATIYPSPSCSDDLCLDMKTPPEGGQVSDLGKPVWLRSRLLGGLKERSGPRQKLLPQRCLLGFCRGQMPLFDRSVAPNFLGDCRQSDGKTVVTGREKLADFSEQVFVVRDQTTFSPPILRIAKKVERGAAQELQLRKQPEHRQHPGAE